MSLSMKNRRINGPVNDHLRSEIYTNKLFLTIMAIHMHIALGQVQNNPWGPFLFENHKYMYSVHLPIS